MGEGTDQKCKACCQASKTQVEPETKGQSLVHGCVMFICNAKEF